MNLLEVRDLEAGYGKIGVLHKASLRIECGEIVTLLGPNGAGKSTLLKALSGLLPWTGGDASFDGASLRGRDPRECARAGLVHVVEGHRVFTQLSVADNLSLAAYDVPKAERVQRIDEALELFPEIAAKRVERVQVTARDVRVTHETPSSSRVVWESPTAFTRVSVDKDEERTVGVNLMLSGREVAVARALSPKERGEFAEALQLAIWEARRERG